MNKSGLKVHFKYNKNQQEKSKKINLKILFATKQYPQMLQKYFWLINRHFPKSHRLHKIFNRNTVKVSYSCMQNMSKIYKGHNSKITSTLSKQLTLCNCWVKGECTMDGKCQTMDAVYDCHVTSFRTTKNILWVGRRKMEAKVL